MRVPTLFAGAILLAVAPASAQSLAMNTPSRSADPLTLEVEALKLHDSPDQYLRAADLYIEAAMLRRPADPLVVHNHRMAARLLFYAGDGVRAQITMEAAGQAALRTGDVVEAAQAFLDAAWLALRRNNVDEMTRLAESAELLMESPLVPEDQRQAVLGRIERRQGYINVRRGSP
jgi:hypothetical protein